MRFTTGRDKGQRRVFRWALRVAWPAVVFVFLAAFSAPAFAAPVPLLDGFQERKLGRELEFFHDADGALTFDEVARRGDANPWHASVTEAPNLGFTTGFLWARLTLRDERIRPAGTTTAYPLRVRPQRWPTPTNNDARSEHYWLQFRRSTQSLD